MTQHESFQQRQPPRRPPFDDDGYPQQPNGPRHGPPQEEVPPWAGLGPEGAPPQQSRGDRAAERRRKRRTLMIGSGAALAVVASVAGYLIFSKSTGPANVISGDLVTTFLPGELQRVPDACTAVPSATLQQYLPGQTKQAFPPLNGGLNSQCSWTLDHAPTYRVIEVDLEAYTPSGLASGDGSATFAAIDAYLAAQSAKQHPGSKTGQPSAQVTTVSGLGDDAFVATQVFNNIGVQTDLVTEVARYKNVLVTVVVNGSSKYSSVSMSDLTAAAQAVAQGAMAKVIG